MKEYSVRTQLTLCYLLVTSAALLLFGVLSFGALRFALIQAKKTHLQGREQRLIQFLENNQAKKNPLPLPEQLENYAVVTHEGNLFEIRNAEGSLLFPRTVDGANLISAGRSDCSQRTFFYQKLEHQPGLAMCHQVELLGRPAILFIGGALDQEFSILRMYRNALLLLTPGLLSLAAVSGYLLSRHALRSVGRMTKAAVNIGIGNLSARLPVPAARDEIQHLAISWNQLLGRLEDAVSRLSRFSADVSHDLRTSITVILAIAQLSLQRPRTAGEYRDDLNKIVGECRTASNLLDSLLSITRSENFSQEVAFQRIDVCELVVNGCRRVEELAESGGIILDWRIPEEAVYVEGDERLLQRLLGILLDNAIKYTPEEGEIAAEVSRTERGVVVTVRDTGVGMTEEVRRRIFERYYQGELRERETQAGNGLGLAIARWIAEAHHAELTVESVPAHSSVFRIEFPAAASQTA